MDQTPLVEAEFKGQDEATLRLWAAAGARTAHGVGAPRGLPVVVDNVESIALRKSATCCRSHHRHVGRTQRFNASRRSVAPGPGPTTSRRKKSSAQLASASAKLTQEPASGSAPSRLFVQLRRCIRIVRRALTNRSTIGVNGGFQTLLRKWPPARSALHRHATHRHRSASIERWCPPRCHKDFAWRGATPGTPG